MVKKDQWFCCFAWNKKTHFRWQIFLEHVSTAFIFLTKYFTLMIVIPQLKEFSCLCVTSHWLFGCGLFYVGFLLISIIMNLLLFHKKPLKNVIFFFFKRTFVLVKSNTSEVPLSRQFHSPIFRLSCQIILSPGVYVSVSKLSVGLLPLQRKNLSAMSVQPIPISNEVKKIPENIWYVIFLFCFLSY